MIIAFLLGLIAIPLFIYGGVFVFLLLPVIWACQQFHLWERWMRVRPELRKKIWQTTLVGASMLVWGLMLKGAA